MSIGSGERTLFTGPVLFSLVNTIYLPKNYERLKYHCLFRMGESEEVKELERMLEEEERDS